jgi:peptidoglycan/xylan/chitin deacetylase (PgdA/CDA1 family)
LPYLHEYNIPSVFFISSANVENNHSFWWDIVYRERIKREVPIKAIQNEISLLKKRKHNGIMQYIISNFGRKALNPISDIDRPFTPRELESFSQDQNVFIGNHTANHAILTNYTESEIRSEIAIAQTSLNMITGSVPEIISYPNGNFSDDVLTISKDEGLRLGVTTFPRKNYLPINLEGITPFLINRFTLSGNVDIKKQCDSFRSDFTLRDFSRKFLKHNEPETY